MRSPDLCGIAAALLAGVLACGPSVRAPPSTATGAVPPAPDLVTGGDAGLAGDGAPGTSAAVPSAPPAATPAPATTPPPAAPPVTAPPVPAPPTPPVANRPAGYGGPMAATPPMGWNGWAHYQCRVDEQVVLDNAQALVDSGLAARGYVTVTVDDCWMAAARDGNGDLVADATKFPHGMAWLGARLHALGLAFGIYEDAGATTCGGLPGSGQPDGGGPDHFARDAALFASWGVDYLKLDGCNLWVAPGQTMEAAYREAYAAQAEALAATGRPIVFSESAPAYFQDGSDWATVLGWVGRYGQLWRVGQDVRIYDPWNAGAPRWDSVMNNYRYTRDLGRFTHPGGWNDPDFIIAGDPGLTADEARAQLTLWSMLSAPLILSSDLTQVTRSPASVALLGNAAVIAVDQDPLGEPATVLAGGTTDVLVKRLANGDRAVAVLNHGPSAVTWSAGVETLGFDACPSCTYRIADLWDGAAPEQLSAALPSHAAALFRVAQVR